MSLGGSEDNSDLPGKCCNFLVLLLHKFSVLLISWEEFRF